ncbi:MAG TPA: hypothetical protein VNF29_16275 [Candidatus Binataceae bacterium]|nr:hypothetical protein [Candidatus Binataceae bacterium]
MNTTSKTLRAAFGLILRDRRYSIEGFALAMGLSPETLVDWYAGKYDGDAKRVEKIVGKFLEGREAVWSAIKAEPHRFEAISEELAGQVERAASQLVQEAGCSHKAELIEAALRNALRDLCLATRRGPTEAPPSICWRCGADQNLPPPEVEREIERNLKSAGWSGWLEASFRERCRAVMASGDRIIGIRQGAVTLRRGDGSILEIARLDG